MSRLDFAASNELRRPKHVASQLSLFPRERAETMALLRVSLDDAAHWQHTGWLSYDAAALETMEDNHIAELVFIRDLARSGLPHSFITELLGELEPPYAYSPGTTAYSFSSGWVEVVFPNMSELVNQHLESWVQEKLAEGDEERLSAASDSIMLALAELGVRNNSER